MSTEALILLIIVLVVAAVAVVLFVQLQKTRRLRSKFGPEYDRTLREAGSARRAEHDLEAREKRVRKYHIRPLTREESARFSDDWRHVQEEFVDNPERAVKSADDLINEALKATGYAVGDFDRCAEDLSVEHAAVV